MLDQYLKSRITDAERLVEQLQKHYDYVSVLGTCVRNKMILVSTHVNSIDEVDSECGFVIKVYKDGRYSEYSCNDIRDLKSTEVVKSVTLNQVFSSDFKVKMLEEQPHQEDYLREDPADLSDAEITKVLTEVKDRTIYKCR